VFSAESANMAMDLAVFSEPRDEHSQDTSPVCHWEIENEVGWTGLPGLFLDPAELLLV